jgi:hypothetical protein
MRTKLWYGRLKKPAYQPPNVAFPIAWSILYTLMAVSGWRVWSKRNSTDRTKALVLWAAQLGVNAAWAPLFFGRHQPKHALADYSGVHCDGEGSGLHGGGMLCAVWRVGSVCDAAERGDCGAESKGGEDAAAAGVGDRDRGPSLQQSFNG